MPSCGEIIVANLNVNSESLLSALKCNFVHIFSNANLVFLRNAIPLFPDSLFCFSLGREKWSKTVKWAECFWSRNDSVLFDKNRENLRNLKFLMKNQIIFFLFLIKISPKIIKIPIIFSLPCHPITSQISRLHHGMSTHIAINRTKFHCRATFFHGWNAFSSSSLCDFLYIMKHFFFFLWNYDFLWPSGNFSRDKSLEGK